MSNPNEEGVDALAAARAGTDWRGWLSFVFTENTPEVHAMPDREFKEHVCASVDSLIPKWEPIETAPKDGTRILGWDGYDMHVCWWGEGHVLARSNSWVAGGIQDDYNTREHVDPTHWQPLPTEPAK